MSPAFQSKERDPQYMISAQRSHAEGGSSLYSPDLATPAEKDRNRWRISDADYKLLRDALLVLIKIDIDHYRTRHMERRLSMLLERRPYAGWSQYVEALRFSSGELIEFTRYFTINVSSFYRDAKLWHVIRTILLPELLQKCPDQGLRAWSVGCSIGAEPYTLAMLLRDEAPFLRHSVTGIDIDESVLQRARQGGPYCAGEVQELPFDLRNRHMMCVDDHYVIRAEVREMVKFNRSNILREEVPGIFDLIMCRNVLIYFAHYVKERIYERLLRHLQPGGILFLGGTETIPIPAKFQLEYVAPSIYRYHGA